MSRAYTREEMQKRFLEEIRQYVWYWLNEKGAPGVRDKLEGLTFSILVILDGESDLPAFMVAPCPHESDKAYHEENGDNYFPPLPPDLAEREDLMDIAGGLHERWSEFTQRR